MSRPAEIAENALHILSDHDGTLAEAGDRISHLAGTKDEMRAAIAYLACQTWTYRRMSDEDAQLALSQIGAIVRGYEAQVRAVKAAAAIRPDQAPEVAA